MTKLRSGIDLVKVSRLAKAYENFGLRFLHRIYDNLEIEQFKKKSTRAKPFFLAKNFAGKLIGRAKLLAKEQGLKDISLSLSDTEEHATALAVAITE